MVPEGWEIKALGRGLDLQGGFAFKSEQFRESGIPIVRISSIHDERVHLEDAPCYSEDKRLSKFLLHDGDILVAMSGATTGKTGRFLSDSRFPHAYLNQRVGRFLFPQKGHFDPDFVWQLISTARFQHLVSIDATGGAQPNISGKEIETLTFTFPPLPEQRKIAEILSTWDRSIETAQALLATARTQKRALMQSLLTGKRRFPEFQGQAWKEVRLGELEVKGSLKLGRGKVISKKDIDANPGEHPIYSSSVINGGLFGTYGAYEFDEELVTWSVDGGGHFFHRPKHKFSVTNVSGWMRADTSRLDYQFLASQLQFLHSKKTFDYQLKAHPSVIRKLYTLLIPSLDEQRAIGRVLAACDDEIRGLDFDIEHLRTEKKALMQQLLTGKRRVTINA